MKGTILDFLKLAAEKPDLTKELVELAARHDFQFTTDELTDSDLQNVAGGADTRDAQATVQVLLRQNYLDAQSALADYAAKLQTFNEEKAGIREHVNELRDAKAGSG